MSTARNCSLTWAMIQMGHCIRPQALLNRASSAPVFLKRRRGNGRIIRIMLPTGTRKTNIFDMLDLPEVISYLIGARFVQENDDVWANMTLYHDNDGDHLWRIVPFDMNLSWGAFFLDNPANDTGIQATNDNHKSFPLYGSSQALSLTSANWNRMYDVIFTVPETRQMFLRRMRSVLDTYVKPTGTAPGLSPIEQKMLPWRDLIADEAANDRAKW